MKYADSLSPRFLDKYANRSAPWGPLGFVTYKRTYARRKDDGTTEDWNETIARCVNGLLGIGARLTREEAETLYDKVFNLKCTFSGRALWQLGTPTVGRLGGDSMMNCWCVATNDPVESFCFAFNELMLGGGVGFNVQREVVYEMPKVKHDVNIVRRDEKDVDFIVPDNREGWVDLLRKVLSAFYFTGKPFSYSTICIRGKGSPIRSFGGTASGPEDLCAGIDHIVQILRGRVGKKLRPIDCLDVMNVIGSVVVAGNVRRSAQIALGDMDDFQYLDAKNWAKGDVPNWRAMSNNSVVCNKYSHLPDKFWSGYNGDGEPYGLVNLTNCRKYGRLVDGPGYRPDPRVIGTNPCLTGDTLVYVADGRSHVPIRALAEDGRDVPVFCFDDKKKVTVRYMRAPRMTGCQVPILKIQLEDGFSVRVTPNHKFMLSDGSYVEAREVKQGDSIKTITRYKASMGQVLGSGSNQPYWWLSDGRRSNKAEHRIIAEFVNGRALGRGEVVHHKDYDGCNNAISNLDVMDKKDHDDLHRLDKMGDNNPMRRAKREWSSARWHEYKNKHSVASAGVRNKRYCGQTNEDLRQAALALTRELGRRFSRKEWVQYAMKTGLPQNFSKWRKDHLGGIVGLAKWAALDLGLDERLLNADPRAVRAYERLSREGYDCEIVNGCVRVVKRCEKCGRRFDVAASRREVSFCSRSCIRHPSADTISRRRQGLLRTIRNKQEVTREKQLLVFTKLRFELGRLPSKKEWQTECSKQKISFEIARGSSPFRYWKDLKTSASAFNHRVVSVEEDGYEDVYNGTVDEFHNFFVGGFEARTADGHAKFVYINNLNCGEVPLEHGESCNLSEIFLPRLEDEKEFVQIAGLMVKVTKSISCLTYIHDVTNAVVNKNHRLGNSVTGFLQARRFHDPKLFEEAYRYMEKVDKEYSKELGVGESIKLTTTKPSGTVSILPQVTPGVHPAYAPYYIRRIRMASSDPLVEVCRSHGYHIEPVVNFDGSYDRNTTVVSFPIKSPEDAICAKDVSAVQQLEYHKWLQTHWADNSVSVTVYYRKDELPSIKEWLAENYDKSVKTVSFLLHSEHGFAQAPYEEITAEQYAEMSKKTRQVTRLDRDQGGEMESMECSSGACPVK